MTTVRGSCLCGEVAWEAAGPMSLMTHCHCSMCRKTHGTAFGTYVGAAADGFRFERGAESVVRFESSPGTVRPFCGRCGSVTPYDATHDRVFVAAGCLDDDPGVRRAAHIFFASRAPWHAVTDDLPRHDAYPPKWSAAQVTVGPRDASDAITTRGSCLCGAVRYEIDGRLERITKCHCRRCRKARSAAHACNAFCGAERFRWTAGETNVASYKVPDADRFANAFCVTCGSKVPRASARVTIPAGSIDGDPGAREHANIFVASKAPWFEITDGLPRHDEYPPA